MSTASPSMGEKAATYARAGMEVFPVQWIDDDGAFSCGHADCSPGKHPMTPRGHLDATTDPEQIAKWWQQWPDANIGHRPAEEEFVLDVDPRNGGNESLAELFKQHGNIETVESITGGGGRHLYLRLPRGVEIVGKIRGYPGIDVKSHDGYVLLPQSNHKSGRRYEWEASSRGPRAIAPQWLIDLLTRRSPARSSTTDDAPIPDGRRNTTLTSLAGRMRRVGMSASEIRAALRTTNEDRCKPPLEENEVDAIAHSVARYSSAETLSTTQEPIELELATEPIDGDRLLNDVSSIHRRFISMSQEQADTLALYDAHTHAFEAAGQTPYPYITSAEKRSGKSRTLELSKALVRHPLSTSNITPAALFRSIESRPTLLMDEVDAEFGGRQTERSEEIRALLNAGFEQGGTAIRCVPTGKSFEAKQFSVYCPKMLAGLWKKLPDTVLDWSIPIELRRKAPGENVARFRKRDQALQAELRDLHYRLASWGAQNVEALVDAQPDLPDELTDRAQDIWEPLLAIADRVGGTWPKRARQAARTLAGQDVAEDDSTGVRLLADIRAAFGDKQRTSSDNLVMRLAGMEESPCGPWRGRDFDPRALARLLKPFGIGPKTIRQGGLKVSGKAITDTVKGYYRSDFEDAWLRYLPPPLGNPSHPSHPSQLPLPKASVGPGSGAKDFCGFPPDEGNKEIRRCGRVAFRKHRSSPSYVSSMRERRLKSSHAATAFTPTSSGSGGQSTLA